MADPVTAPGEVPLALNDAPGSVGLPSAPVAPADGEAMALGEFLADPAAAAVRLEPTDDPRALVPEFARLDLVEVMFHTYRDGRGYSTARILREAGYRGELRAAGDVLVDQIAHMRRAGFDSFAPARPLDPAAAERALARYPAVYQAAEDGRLPAWTLRHG